MIGFAISTLLLSTIAVEARPGEFSMQGNGTGICDMDYATSGEYLVPCPWDCSKFYACEEGNIALEMDCAPPLHFDPSLGVCNWPDLVNCEASTTTEEPTDAPTDAPTTVDDNGEETTVFSMEFLF